MATYLDQSLAQLEQFEGAIPWMYVDTVGKVTVGVGLMLPNVEAALKLPFLLNGAPATESAIAADFARVAALPMGRPAQFYRKDGCVGLAQSDMDSLLKTVLLGFEGELRTALTGYDSFPDGVKMALLDMAYNLGPVGLLKGYPKLIRAVQAGNWAAAAAASFRHGPGAARNQWTARMFTQSIAKNLQASSEGPLKRLGYGLLGIGAAAVARIRRK